MKNRSFSVRTVLFAMAVVLGFTLAVPAQAQFVCVGNSSGTVVPPGTADGSGATATGGPNVACGTNANASGVGSQNTATGPSADAHGDNVRNVATGNNAN